MELSSSLAAAAISGLVIHLIIAYFSARQRAFARRDSSTGELVLEYGRHLKMFPLVMSVFWVALMTPLLFLFPPTEKDAPALAAVVLIVAVPLALWMLMIGDVYRIGIVGIERRSLWRVRRLIPWHEVVSVSYSTNGYFLLRGSGGSMRISTMLNGLADLADAIRARLPREVWMDAALQLSAWDRRGSHA